MPGLLPANRVEAFAVTVAASTPATAPVETSTNFLPGRVVVIELAIPGGHVGLTGLRFLLAHGQVIPFTRGAWIQGDSVNMEWNLIEYLETGVWSVSAYNTDVFPHTFYIRYLVNDIVGSLAAAPLARLATPVLV